MSSRTACRMVDQVVDTDGQCCELTRVYKIGGDVVRIRVRLDVSDVAKSYAVAEVLTADRKWTDLAEDPADNWFCEAQCADYAPDIETGLHVVADQLYERAAAILT
jgi:hypothetical protein